MGWADFKRTTEPILDRVYRRIWKIIFVAFVPFLATGCIEEIGIYFAPNYSDFALCFLGIEREYVPPDTVIVFLSIFALYPLYWAFALGFKHLWKRGIRNINKLHLVAVAVHLSKQLIRAFRAWIAALAQCFAGRRPQFAPVIYDLPDDLSRRLREFLVIRRFGSIIAASSPR